MGQNIQQRRRQERTCCAPLTSETGLRGYRHRKRLQSLNTSSRILCLAPFFTLVPINTVCYQQCSFTLALHLSSAPLKAIQLKLKKSTKYLSTRFIITLSLRKKQHFILLHSHFCSVSIDFPQFNRTWSKNNRCNFSKSYLPAGFETQGHKKKIETQMLTTSVYTVTLGQRSSTCGFKGQSQEGKQSAPSDHMRWTRFETVTHRTHSASLLLKQHRSRKGVGRKCAGVTA